MGARAHARGDRTRDRGLVVFRRVRRRGNAGRVCARRHRRAVFGYLADVFVFERARGRGVGKALVEAVVGHDDVSSLSRLTLATNDAHRLYEQYGFGPLEHVERWMCRRAT